MRPYSKRALAQLVVDGHDTASAANLFGRKIDFIQHEQSTSEYQRILERLLGQRRPAGVNTARVTSIAEEVVGDASRPSEFQHVRSIEIMVGEERTDIVNYTQGNPLGKAFVFKVYDNAQDYANDENELTENEISNISFDPETPVQEVGTHVVFITYTVNSAGKVFVRFYAE